MVRADYSFHREILTTIGRKYDQYLDFRQQDAHEFLRHMLDAMRMEELDVSALIPVHQPGWPLTCGDDRSSRNASHGHQRPNGRGRTGRWTLRPRHRH